MKFIKCSVLLLLVLLASAAAINIDLNRFYLESDETVVPINGSCNEEDIPVAFQVVRGEDTLWVGQSITNDGREFDVEYYPPGLGNYTLFVACGGENDEENFCIGTGNQCGLEEEGGMADQGVTRCNEDQCIRNWGRINAGESDTLEVQGMDVTSISFEVRSTVSMPSSLEISPIDRLPTNIPSSGASFPTQVYEMYEITTNPIFDITEGTIQFQVQKSWANQNNLAPGNIAIFRYTTTWVKLTTTLLRQDSRYLYYEAKTPGFSYFVVGSTRVQPAETCSDGIKNQGEAKVDCGGPCDACPIVRPQPPAATCTDGIRNQGETSVDCGGPCAACAPPPAAPTCFDGIRNQGEQDTDCGGPCTVCPSCFDNIQNQGEQGVDCGGPCTPCAEEVPLYKDPVILGSVGAVLLLIILLTVFFLLKKKSAAKELRHITELREYVRRQVSVGHSRESVRKAVQDAGWSEKDIRKVF